MVVNMASLPSTVTVLGGAFRLRGTGACGSAGAGEGVCAGAGAGVCPAAGSTVNTQNPNTAICRLSFLIPFAVVLAGPVSVSVSACAIHRTGGRISGRSKFSSNATAFCQFTSPQRTPSRNPARFQRSFHCFRLKAFSLPSPGRVVDSFWTTLAPSRGIS